MSHQVISVTFEVDAPSHKDGIFSMPTEVCEFLGGLKNGDPRHLVIQSMNGAQLYAGEKTLASGREIYGADLKDHIKAGQRIRVTASKP
jgi:hypothetical protein